MHILMIAPEPFFEPRGTPFSEFHRIKALIALGHTVDLVTYPFGRDVEMPGLTVIRCLRPPLVRHVRIGPSWAKVPLDAAAGRHRAAAGAEHVLRRRPLARGGRPDRRGAGGDARRAAPLRHAFEPAAAALELRLLVVPAAGVGHGADRAAAGAALARRDRDLPAARRRGARHRSAGPDRADRERAGLGRSRRSPAPARRCARPGASSRTCRSCSTPGPSRPIRASTCSTPPPRACGRRGRTSGSSSWAGSRTRSRRPGCRRDPPAPTASWSSPASARPKRSRSSSTRRRCSPRRAAAAPTRR